MSIITSRTADFDDYTVEEVDANFLMWPGQAEFVEATTDQVWLFTGAGYGKCLREGTLVLTADGRQVPVQNIRKGDRLAGPSGVRKVLCTNTGVGQMYEVRPLRGEPWACNADHILTLVCSFSTPGRIARPGDVIDVSVREWLGWSAKKRSMFKLFRTPFDFETAKKPLPLEPYFLGLLLGDGCFTQGVRFTTQSPILLAEVERQAEIFGLRVTSVDLYKSAPCYNIVGDGGTNPLTGRVRALGLHGTKSGTKFIPQRYKTASREDRLAILAGLMDTDGARMETAYDYITKSPQLAQDVAFIARSVGIAAHVASCQKGCQTGVVGTYWRVILSGTNTRDIPSRIKPLPERKQAKDALRTGFDIVPVGVETFYGFTLDGDGRFLLGDFTVTHNSDCITWRIVQDAADNDGWWDGRYDYFENPLTFILGAPADRYLTARTIPALRSRLTMIERLLGRRLRAQTGRSQDGWFEAAGRRRQELCNAIQILCYPLDKEEAGVATDASALYLDEVTMMTSEWILHRVFDRVRDPRARKSIIAGVGTPEKSHFIYPLVMDPQTDTPRAGCTVIMDSAVNNPMLPDHKFKNMAGASDQYIEAQLMGKWVKGSGGEWFADVFSFEKHIHPMDINPREPGIRFDIGWDPGHFRGAIVIGYHHPRLNAWCIVDQVNLEKMTTRDGCKELKRRGYNINNIRSISMDPRDAGKMRSSSEGKSDADIVREEMGITPYYVDSLGFNAKLRVRLEALKELLKDGKILFNDTLIPRSRQEQGIINSIQFFAVNLAQDSEDKFVEVVTRATKDLWKHHIDALHYMIMRYEHGVYRRAKLARKIVRGTNRTRGT